MLVPEMLQYSAIFALIVGGFVAAREFLHAFRATQRRKEIIAARRAAAREQIYFDIDERTGRLTESAANPERVRGEFLEAFGWKALRYFRTFGDTIRGGSFRVRGDILEVNIRIDRNTQDIVASAIGPMVNHGRVNGRGIPVEPVIPHGDCFAAPQITIGDSYADGTVQVSVQFRYVGAKRYTLISREELIAPILESAVAIV